MKPQLRVISISIVTDSLINDNICKITFPRQQDFLRPTRSNAVDQSAVTLPSVNSDHYLRQTKTTEMPKKQHKS